MTNRTIFLPVCIIIFLTSTLSMAQEKSERGMFGLKRKKVEIPNYYISLKVNNRLTLYTGLIEWKIDSISDLQTNAGRKQNLLLLKYNLISVLSRTAFHSDPIVAAFDIWALNLQLSRYFRNEQSRDLYGDACPVLIHVFESYAHDCKENFDQYLTDQNRNSFYTFTDANPILNDNLDRASVEQILIEWLRTDELGLKSGLLSMADLARGMSSRMEYYSEMLPKQTKWQIEYDLNKHMPSDSLTSLIGSVQDLIIKSGALIDQMEPLIRENRDTVLDNINYQRTETLIAIRNERIAILNAISQERQIVLEAIKNERKAIEEFAHNERLATMKDVEGLSDKMLSDTKQAGKDLIDYIFIRIIILCAVIGMFIILMFFLYKKALIRS